MTSSDKKGMYSTSISSSTKIFFVQFCYLCFATEVFDFYYEIEISNYQRNTTLLVIQIFDNPFFLLFTGKF